jgi:hypothetical protein
MTDIPKKLSETARAVLTFAATRTDHLVRPPKLPAAAARQVIRSLLKGGLVDASGDRTWTGSDLSGGRHPSSACGR